MALIKYKLGDLIQQRREKYDGTEALPIKGVSREGFISPKQEDADLSIYNVFYRYDFVFNPARMELNSIAINTYYDKAICSSLYEIFYVTRTDILLPDYLNLYIKRDEFARKCWFEAVGSARNYFRVSNLSEFVIELPSISIQQKYVNIFKAMVANQESYERGLEDLRILITAYVEREKSSSERKNVNRYLLGHLITQRREKYDGSEIPIRGVSREGFIEPKQPDADLHLYNQYYLYDFVFNPARMELNSIALNTDYKKACCSSLYEIFFVNRPDVILPQYLNLLLKRDEFARWCEYVGWGSAREYCRVETISNYPIVVPSIKKQRAIVEMANAYDLRKKVNERLSAQIKDICPILIKGSLEE